MKELLKLLENLKGRKLIVIGDVMLDEYYDGEIMRISPEAPVPVVKSTRHWFALGGAANAANNGVSLGSSVELLGAIGDDEKGRILLSLAKKCGISTTGIITLDKRPTTHKTRVLAHGRQLLRFDEEEDKEIPVGISNRLISDFQTKIATADAVLISDYNKGAITKSSAKKIIQICNSRNKPVAIDSKNYLSYDMKDATILKPNLKELRRETGVNINSDKEIDKGAQMLLRKLNSKSVLVTMGERGMRLYGQKGKHLMPGLKTGAVDVSGAGDTVITTMLLAIASGGTHLDAAKLANYAAAAAVQKIGTQAPSIKEIEELIGKTN